MSFNQDFGVNTIQNYAGRRVFTPETVESTYSAQEREIFEQAQAAGRVFNYEEELYGEKGFITDSRLSVSGGNDRTGFYVNASHRDEDGIMKNTGYRRTSMRLNLDHEITENLEISFSGNYIDSKSDRGPVGNENNGGFSVGYNLALLLPTIGKICFPMRMVFMPTVGLLLPMSYSTGIKSRTART